MVAISKYGPQTAHPEEFRVAVSDFTARIFLENGDTFEASFYLRMSSANATGREALAERLNDPSTLFLACKAGDEVQLFQLKAVVYIQVNGQVAEVDYLEQLGASRQAATLTLRGGETLRGEFLSILPPNRSRVSDLLNSPDERFLLFLMPDSCLWVNRDYIVRVSA